MKPLQIILLVAFFPTILLFSKLQHMRSRRIILRSGLMVIVMAYYFVLLFPDIVDEVSNFLGIGRAADLVLYATSATLLFFIFVVISKMNLIEKKIQILNREIALYTSNSEKQKD